MKDVIVIGAGPCGIGISVLLKKSGIDFTVLDRYGIGASFARWPKEMILISPSFDASKFGFIDLNAITTDQSPSYILQSEHCSGKDYQRYLNKIADDNQIDVEKADVRRIIPKDGSFIIETDGEPYHSRYVIWCAGEFQYPNDMPFEGAQFCVHTSKIRSFSEIKGDMIIIGGFESGIDSALHLAHYGHKATVIDSGAPWDILSKDPSIAISPHTKDRLRQAPKDRIILKGNSPVIKVEYDGKTFKVITKNEIFESENRPIIATGFKTSLVLVKDLFEKDEKKHMKITDKDESTITPGLFLLGPYVWHKDMVHCFIYKYKTRFGVITQEIAKRLGKEVPADSIFAPIKY